MKVAAITRFKHGSLFELLQQFGWTQKEFAKRCGVKEYRIGNIVNLRNRPSLKLLEAMQRVFNDAGVTVDVLEMFPDYYVGFGRRKSPRIVQVCDLSSKQLENFIGHQQLTLEDAHVPVAETLLDSEEALRVLHDRSVITEREERILTLHFVEDKSYTEIAEEFGLSHERISQLVRIALCKIRRSLKTDFERATAVRDYERSTAILSG